MEKSQKTIVLAGNPNVGKSVVFGRLTGQYAVVSNYPGTTVDITEGQAVIAGVNYRVIDTPGTNSLLPFSEDEQVTRSIIFSARPDILIHVVDSKNLKRSLVLTSELADLGIPMILVLNMYDEARSRGIKIDARRLEKLLGIPVVKTVVITGEGISELKKIISAVPSRPQPLNLNNDVESLISEIEKELPADFAFKRALSLMLLLGDKSAWRFAGKDAAEKLSKRVEGIIATFMRSPHFLIHDARDRFAGEASAEVFSFSGDENSVSWLSRLGMISMRPFPGYLIAALALFVTYEFVGVFAAGTVVDFLEDFLFKRQILPFLEFWIDRIFAQPVITDFLVGKYGLISMALTYALAIVLPIVGAFFIVFGFMEDSGYLPRLSVMLDRAFRKFGLNGKAVLPMVLGLGCGTMAAMGSRILESKKERLIAVLLLSLTIPCSAQIGVILGLLSGLSYKATLIWLLSITLSLTFVGYLASKIIPGTASCFVMEIPPLRKPELSNILLKVKMRVAWYFKEAVPLFILGTLILFAADKLNLIKAAERIASPVISGLLGLPAMATESFILGFLRRDYGAAGLFMLTKDGFMDPRQVVVSIIAITLFVPCIAQSFMVIKEQGYKIAFMIFAFVSVYALLFAGLVNFILRTFSIL
ncbi:MAG TPA: ferrous iron transport protein B [Elusimicrobia bacterium]|nr:MAG: ferrous iron transport protein B [Elusimicrobia bacterium RIFOXYA12_FULL_49_49]OGS16375.1 MAG: ferrous iron transport protein B [Elusimicrobia bacterium RIFOXYA2_FULL_47_53]OGS27248.1 MAG: ferrous iron transport protein B [Elusimicrobia bacterium RIFOXYB12_FULL_50_12]OGS30448.1 MAG: ferrous iron transport protein B [Elusimicrobia bacterium RIFOXYB2_FULL_46_23]HBU69437.1 ferrous iron transport protein B [Elusimicrobiota bacterium]